MIHSKQNIPQLKIALLLIVTFLLLSSCGPEKSEDVKDVTCIICTETEAPTNPSITINGGNAGTNSTEVTLTLAASDNTGIRGYYVSENASTPDTNDAAPAKSPLSFYDTAVDPATGLMWQREDDGTMRNWSNAGSYCSNLSLAGYSDWRLPTKDELVSIVDTSFGSPTINTDVFPNTQPSRYWSSTSYASNTTYAWDVSFLDGDVNADAKTNSNSNVVRCVRG